MPVDVCLLPKSFWRSVLRINIDFPPVLYFRWRLHCCGFFLLTKDTHVDVCRFLETLISFTKLTLTLNIENPKTGKDARKKVTRRVDMTVKHARQLSTS